MPIGRLVLQDLQSSGECSRCCDGPCAAVMVMTRACGRAATRRSCSSVAWHGSAEIEVQCEK